MQVDETGRDDQACGVNLPTRTDRLFVQRDYLTVPDTDMAHSVQACFRVDNPSTENRQVVRACLRDSRQTQAQAQAYEECISNDQEGFMTTHCRGVYDLLGTGSAAPRARSSCT